MSHEIFNGSPSPLLSAEETESIFVSRGSCSGGWGRPAICPQLISSSLMQVNTPSNSGEMKNKCTDFTPDKPEPHFRRKNTNSRETGKKKWGEVLYSQLAKNCKTETPTINASNLCDSPCWKDWKSEGNWLNTIVLTYPQKESTTRANQYFIIFLFFPAHLTEEKSSTWWAYFYFIDFTQDTGKFIDQPLIKGSYNVHHLSINIICPSSPVHLAYVPQIVWF